ncbi:protein S100-A1-like [Xiphias gladius]|uniref:protein S100-A1-like n=1 Tax=Xiphias gladius TaxID=8245 RepID=UPI001A994C38|nr:protein S100-A1-like [Xiphias gladius]
MIGTGTNVSKLESAMDTLIEVFQCYASKGGNKYKLDFLELRRLIQGELSHYLQDSWDCRRVAEIMSDLDKNRDGGVSFEEFVALVTQLTVTSTTYFKGYTPVVFHCGQMKDGRFQRL